MEECWDDTGPYALAKLADRVVPVPRDEEAQVSLYALCRSWVRNCPSLPLVADGPPPTQRDTKEAAVRLGEGAGARANGDGLAGQGPPPQQEAHGQQEAQQGGLLSILPPPLPPTSLETDTCAPTYPWDDFETREPEEALRKFKDHWMSVRQYHQSVRRAKLSRHRQRLQVLFGEESMLQPQTLAVASHPTAQPPTSHHPQQAVQGQQHPQQPLLPPPHQNHEQAGAALAGPLQDPMSMANGAAHGLVQQVGLGSFQGSLVLPGLMPGGGGDPRDAGLGGIPGGASGGPVSAAEAQAALAAIMNLGQLDSGVDTAMQQQGQQQGQQPPLFPQQLGLPVLAPPALGGNGSTAAPPLPSGHTSAGLLGLQPMDMLLALQQQQQQLAALPQAAGQAQGAQPLSLPQPLQQQLVLGQMPPQAAEAAMDAGTLGASMAAGIPGVQEAAAAAAGLSSGLGRDGVEGMEVDPDVPNGS
ncbi:hypothetical protein Agub_g11797 [Astrephomene gubernaculifera]|uniref:Uncharacterized protein n=1 Tax=Astrephomene gubernaculifera TaxID=47775 RepID=A0AAD3HR74_9CHLO|nr:hypothetical protein Agub_g11797 [Astrephomene gubernaculifera]